MARRLVAPGKGVLAADDRLDKLAARFRAHSIDPTTLNRRAYRELLFSTPWIETYISGVILHEEALAQAAADGTPFPDLLRSRGIIPGVKADRGCRPLRDGPELVTNERPDLDELLATAATHGAGFAKWHAVFQVGPASPSQECLAANADRMTRFALACHRAGLLPLVEPEVLAAGGHGIEECAAATGRALSVCLRHLAAAGVDPGAVLLKTNFAVPGVAHRRPAAPREVAAATIAALRASVPPEVAGVLFLSGGLSDREATAFLDAVNRAGPAPWQLSFSFGRALQRPVLAAWRGRPEAVGAAQRVFRHRARCVAAARRGAWRPMLEDSQA